MRTSLSVLAVAASAGIHEVGRMRPFLTWKSTANELFYETLSIRNDSNHF